MGGVEPNTTEDQMKEFFSQYGPVCLAMIVLYLLPYSNFSWQVISVDLKKDKTTDRIRGLLIGSIITA